LGVVVAYGRALMSSGFAPGIVPLLPPSFVAPSTSPSPELPLLEPPSATLPDDEDELALFEDVESELHATTMAHAAARDEARTSGWRITREL